MEKRRSCFLYPPTEESLKGVDMQIESGGRNVSNLHMQTGVEKLS